MKQPGRPSGGHEGPEAPVFPAKAGTSGRPAETLRPEVPAFAGMTGYANSRLAFAIASIPAARVSGFFAKHSRTTLVTGSSA